MTRKSNKRTICHWHFGGCWQYAWLIFWLLVCFPVAIFYYFTRRYQVCEEINEIPVKGEVR